MKNLCRLMLAIVVIKEVAPMLYAATTYGGGQVSQAGTWNLTNITGTISLPTGASIAAKQPTLGTAGSPSTDVISIQGVANGTGVPVLPATSASPSNTRVTVTTADTQILAANANRKALECQSLITNTDRIFRKWNASAATTNDYPMEAGADWTPPVVSTAAVRGIANSGSQVIVCTEY